MQLANRIGNIEQSNEQVDFDRIEREIGQEIGEENAVDVHPSPAQAAAQNKPAANAPQTAPVQTSFLANLVRGRGFSKFTPLEPPKPTGLLGTLRAAMSAIVDPKRPQGPLESRFDPRLNQKPANDAKKDSQKPDAPNGPRSRLGRTIDTLMSLGALPMHLLVEIGRIRQAKDSRFGSVERLEKGLAQGNDEAIRVAHANPGLVKKKDLLPPAPTGPGP
jgi:hypothetical protein